MKTISILDNTATHLPHLFAKGDRVNLGLEKIIVTDYYLGYQLSNKSKFAWLVEPECVLKHSYDYIKSNYKKFDRVFTHDKSILNCVPNASFMPFGTTFIEEKDFKIYEKSKLASIVSSGKNFTPGHSFRLKVLDEVKNKVDAFGREINPVNYKLDCLKDYMFSIAVENSKHDFWFTEKLLDCFLTGTIPLYWGCPSIEKFFNMDGIITFDSIEDLQNSLKTIDKSYYNNKIKAIQDNFNLAKKYVNPYDGVYNFVNSI